MIDFFLTYMSQDSIGVLSTAHLVASDRFGRICDVFSVMLLMVDFGSWKDDCFVEDSTSR